MKVSEETVKIELHTIATYDGKEYELEELMNNMFKINAELHSIIKEVREEIIKYKEIMENGIEQGAYYSYLGSLQQKLDKFLEILDKEGNSDE